MAGERWSEIGDRFHNVLVPTPMLRYVAYENHASLRGRDSDILNRLDFQPHMESLDWNVWYPLLAKEAVSGPISGGRGSAWGAVKGGSSPRSARVCAFVVVSD